MKKLTLVCLIVFAITALQLQAAEIDPDLQMALSDLQSNGTIPVLAYMEQQADIASLNAELKAENATLAERNKRAILSLQEVATRTQPEMVAFLEQLKARDLIGEYHMFWIANMFKVEATEAGVEALAGRDDIQTIYLDYQIEGIKPVSVEQDNNLLTGHEIGLERINANLAWAQGWTGAGRVVMNIDTGVEGTHPALSARFRGDVDQDGDVDESWFDPYTTNYPTPIDDGGHGTHTMGTICGRTAGGDTIGVAIDAQWIAAAAIDRGGGIPRTVADAIASFQWAVDPDGNPNTQDNPDAIGNSWGVTTSHGYPPCDQTFWTVIDNCEAAGSVVVFSAGNEGPTANSLRRPADRGTTPYNCFSVGAVDGANANLPIASFSSRGPSNCGPNGETVIKPEVVAPGVNVRSSYPGGGYTTLSGTSMASPHITGAVAVIRQVNPNLDAETVKQILINTSRDLPFSNPDGEDNTFGNGVIDLFAACQAAMSGYGFISGHVRDAGNQPINGAQVRIMGGFLRDYADSTGYYYIGAQADTTYDIEASYFGYIPATAQAAVVPNETTTVNFVLQTAPSGTLQGTVIDLADSTPIQGANVEIAGTPITPVTTDSLGFYHFAAIPGGSTYTVRVRASGYGIGQDTVFIPTGGGATRNFALGAFESFENDDAGWVGAGVWEWGEPTTGPNGAFDGTRVWGTVLGGTYPNSADDPLITGYFTIDDAFASLSFYHWHEFESGYDGGNVSVSTDGGFSWELITPDGDYPDQSIVGLDNEPGFTGNSADWEQKVFDMGAYQGATLKFRFRFGSDGSVVRAGWYIDAVVLSGGTSWNNLAPDINVSPMSFHANLNVGDTLAMPLTISNTGEGLLELSMFAITSDRAAAVEPSWPSQPASFDETWTENISYEKNGDLLTASFIGPKPVDNNAPINPPMILDTGGPDAYGYTWIDSDEPGGPVFEWIDISSVGTPITLGDDVNVGPFDLGFDFEYYGEVFSTIRVASNGFVTFTSTSGSLSNTTIPNANEPNNLLAIFWDDLAPHNGGQVYYYSDTANNRFIVSYDGVPHYSNYGALYFQVIIYQNGNIVYQYGSMNDGGHGNNGATVGIENGTGTDGLQVIYNQDGIVDNMVILFRKPVFWLRVEPRAGLVFPAQAMNGSVVFDATVLDLGQYAGSIRVQSNDPDEGTIVLPCTLNVGPVGIAEGSGEMPKAFSLAQNYPNPFNPSTQISFSLPSPGDVSLAVFDILGKKVKSLVSGKLEAGIHSITWDGTDQSGAKVSSGIYFYHIKAGDFSQSRKMLLMK